MIMDTHNETLDDFLGGKITMFQPRSGYRSGLDPLLLAYCLPRNLKGTMLDLGCGSGIIPLCALWSNPELSAVGLEMDLEAVDRAQRSAALNGFSQRFTVHHHILSVDVDFIENNSMDVVTMNPPWFDQNSSQKAQGSRGDGRTEGNWKLQDWLDYGIKKLKPKGVLAIIHRAYRLDDILHSIYGKMGNIKIIPIYSHQQKSAKNIIVLAQKGRKTPLELTSGFITYDDNGSYTKHMQDIQMGNWVL